MQHEEERSLAVSQQFSERARITVVVLLALASFVALCGLTTMLVASDQLREFTEEAAAIFTAHLAYMQSTANGVLAEANSLTTVSEDVVAATSSTLSSFGHKTSAFTASLHSLDSLRRGFVFFAVILSCGLCLAGLAAAYAQWYRLSLVLGTACFFAIGCLWANLLIAQAAANVFYDLCSVIDSCHFCVEAGAFPCAACHVPFFQALSSCPVTAANQFSGLQGTLSTGAASAAAQVSAAVTTLCMKAPCFGSTTGLGNAAVLAATGLSGILVGPSAATAVPISVYATTAANASTYAADVVTDYASFSAWLALGTSLATLNCSAPNAFVEWEAPQPSGTFDALQQHLCPQINYPINPPQVIFARLAVGAIVAAVAMHGVLVALVLGHKRFRGRGGDAAQVGAQTTWLLRPSAYAAVGNYDSLPSVASQARVN